MVHTSRNHIRGCVEPIQPKDDHVSPVVKRLLHREPLLRVDSEHLPDQVLSVVTDVLPPATVQEQPALADRVVQPVLGAEEGEGPRQQDVQQHPAAPDVHRLAVGLPDHHLGGHEVRRPDAAAIHTLQQESDKLRVRRHSVQGLSKRYGSL